MRFFDEAEFDHIKRSEGNPTATENDQLFCISCNRRKGAR
ncbi:MAG: HNH endonuclease [Candidatus Syntropharchaeia archaeon]